MDSKKPFFRRYSPPIGLLILCFLFVFSTTVNAEIKTITSLPYTVYSSDNYDTLILASSNMSATGRAISFADDVHDVYLDLDQDTIRWNTSGAINTWGIEIMNSNIYNITVNGGYIIHSPPASALDIDIVLRARAVGLGGRVHDITIQNSYFEVYGRNSQIVYGGNGCYNIDIFNCVFNDQMTGFTQRDMWIDNAMLALGNNDSQDGSGFEYHFKISSCTTLNAHWCNLYIQGSALVAQIYDNYFVSDARNDVPNSGIIYGTAAQCYAVSIRGGDTGSRVKFYDNTIRSGNNYAGGRGIFISGIDGISLDPDSSIYIYNNDIFVHQGDDEEETTLNGILVRQGWKNVYIRDNQITCVGDTDPSTNHTEHGPLSGLRLTGPGDGLKIVGNTIKTYFLDDFSPDYGTPGTYAGAIVFDEFDMNQPNIIIDSNIFESNSLLIKWGFFNGHGGNVTMRDNTYSFYNSQGDYVFYLGYGAGGSHHAYNNKIIDGLYTNGATSTNIFMDDSESDSLSIALAKTVNVRIMDTLNDLRSNVQVSVMNNYGETIASGVTNQNGVFDFIATYWWESNDTFSEGDSVDFNNFNIIVQDGSDIKVWDYYIDANSVDPTLIIDGQIDSIPPDPIDDLGCTPGTSEGSINLTWTATGNDSSTGIASHYIIKYSTSPISEQNFDGLSTVYSHSVDPAIAGSTETLTMSGLFPGTLYYIAIKAYDFSWNASNVSNVVSCEAKVNLGTGGEDDTTYVSENLSPQAGAILPVNQPILSAENITAAGTNYYYFEVSQSSAFNTITRASTGVIQNPSGTTSWQIDTTLESGTTYYWRTKVNNFPYSQISNFSIQSASNVASTNIKAFPSPVNFSEAELVTFSLPNTPVDLLIQTVSGETVLLKRNITGNWQWDGHNSANNRVVSGVYLWYVTSNGKVYSGKIVNR